MLPSEAGAAREPGLRDSLTRRGSYFWKRHPRGLQWMLLVLLPALTVLESLVELRLAASELFKHRKGVIAYTGNEFVFFRAPFG